MSQFNFSRLPNKWVHDGTLVRFKGGGEQGQSIAALKIMLALALKNGFSEDVESLSFSKISELTGLSRPMIRPSIDFLEFLALISVNRSLRTHSYTLRTDPFSTWARLPQLLLQEKLPLLSNRNPSTLYALKIYLVLHTYRSNYSTHVMISHEKLREKTGIQTRQVRKGIDILINHGFIGLARTKNPDGSYGINSYTILGLRLPKERQGG